MNMHIPAKINCHSKNTLDFSLFLIFLHRSSKEMNNDIVVEMKTEKANEEAGLLNKRPSVEQVRLPTHASQPIFKRWGFFWQVLGTDLRT